MICKSGIIKPLKSQFWGLPYTFDYIYSELAIHLSFLAFHMFVHYFVNYFVRLLTNHYTLLTVSPISFIFDSVRNLTRNLPYRPLWCFVKIPIVWREWRNARWEKWLARQFTKCHLYTSRFSRFANIFSRSRQFGDKCIAGCRMVPICDKKLE